MATIPALVAALREAAAMLDAVGERAWASTLSGAAVAGERGDGAEVLVGSVGRWFGGMGSLNDLVLTDPADPTRADPALNSDWQERLRRLRTAWEDAVVAKRRAPAPPTPRPP